jgi:hypothetical protein
VLEAVVVEREEVVTMGQEMVPDGDLDRALGMGRLVAPPVQFTLVEAAREGVVEEDKMVGPGMVQDPVLATARLVVMGLAVAHTLRREGKVEAEVAAVDNMGVLDLAPAQALGMVKLVGMGHMVVGMLREVDKVEVVAVDKMVALEVGLVLVQDTAKLVGTGHMVEDMPTVAAKEEEGVVVKIAGLDKVLVQAQDMVKLVATVLTMVVDMLMRAAKAVAAVADKVV